MTQELINKAKECKSAEELLSLAKENGIELTLAEAREKYAALHNEGELSDDELDATAGGGCGGDDKPGDYVKPGDRVQALHQICSCTSCGGMTFIVNEAGAYVYTVTCTSCGVKQPTGDGLGNPEADNGKYYKRI